MRPICLPAGDDDYAGSEAKAAGWGKDEDNNNVNKLRRTDFTVIDQQRCRSMFEKSPLNNKYQFGGTEWLDMDKWLRKELHNSELSSYIDESFIICQSMGEGKRIMRLLENYFLL